MVSVLDSRLSGRGSSPGRRHCIVFLGRTLDSHSATLHTNVQMGTGELKLGVTLQCTSIQSRGSRNIPSHLMLQKTGISSGHLTLPCFSYFIRSKTHILFTFATRNTYRFENSPIFLKFCKIIRAALLICCN